jgi:hypothetical protein
METAGKFNAEKILEKQTLDGKVEYLMKNGYPDDENSWEVNVNEILNEIRFLI